MRTSEQAFSFTVAAWGRHWRLDVAGGLDLHAGARLVELAGVLRDAPGGNVQIDVAGVDFIDTAGLYSLLSARRVLADAGIEVSLTGLGAPAVVRVTGALRRAGRPVDLVPQAPGGARRVPEAPGGPLLAS